MTFSNIGSFTSYNPKLHHLHVVKNDESLDSIAASHRTSEGEIRQLNPDSKFEIDELLLIPRLV